MNVANPNPNCQPREVEFIERLRHDPMHELDTLIEYMLLVEGSRGMPPQRMAPETPARSP